MLARMPHHLIGNIEIQTGILALLCVPQDVSEVPLSLAPVYNKHTLGWRIKVGVDEVGLPPRVISSVSLGSK